MSPYIIYICIYIQIYIISTPEAEESGEQEDVQSQASGTCTSECCASQNDKPYHPTIDYSSTRRIQGKQTRSFNALWFKEHKWLTFCVPRSGVFCFYCRPSIAAQLSTKILMDQEKHRDLLLKQFHSLQYLTRQGLAIRGHGDEDGNLHQLLKCRAHDITGIEQWIENGSYQSHDIINEMMQLMANQLLQKLLNEVRSAEWYSIIADETRDISGAERLGVSIRWVENDYQVHEDLIGLVEVEATDAAALCSIIKDVLLRVNLQLSQCHGQAYDGAANMAGHLNGLAVRLQSEEHRMLHVHCMAHCLNLCLQDCSRNCCCVRDALDLTFELNTLICASPKRLALFQQLKNELSYTTPGLKPLCPTRWTVRTAALTAVIKNYAVICSELELISKDSCGEPSLSYLVFSATEQLSRTLQNSKISAQEAYMAAAGAKRFLKRQRMESSSEYFYRTAVEESKDPYFTYTEMHSSKNR